MIVEPIFLPTHKLDAVQLANWSYRVSFWRLAVFYAAFALIAAIALAETLQLTFWIALAIFLLIVLSMLALVRYRLMNIYRSKNRNQILQPRTLKLDARCFELEYQNGVFSRIPWSVVHKLVWSKEFLAIYTSLGNPILIPRPILTDEATALIKTAVSTKSQPVSPYAV
jgi:hypothetical protein